MRSLIHAAIFLAVAAGVCVEPADGQFAPPRRCPDQPAAPTGDIAAGDFVELQFEGYRPEYSVRLGADGTVVWNGKFGVETKGPATRQVSPEAARALIESYRASYFWGLCDKGWSAADAPEITVTLHLGDREKSVTGGDPDWNLYRKVSELTGTYYWIRGTPRAESIEHLALTDSDFAPKPGFTELMRDAIKRDLRAVQHEITGGGANVNAQDASGFTALMAAALRRDPEVMTILLNAGADPNLRSNQGQTALMAASAGPLALSEKTFLVLADAHADLNAQDRSGQSVLMLAAQDRDGQSALMLDAPKDEAALIANLLKLGASRDARDAAGHSALDRVTSALDRFERQAAATGPLGVSDELRRRRLQQVRNVLQQP